MSLRLERMYSVLTAGERARLVLKAIKEESREDPIWRSTAPPHQAKEFNRLLHLINGVDKGVGGLVLLLEVQASALAERVQALEHFKFVAGIAALAGRFVAEVREPISATDYESLRRAAAQRVLSLSEVADLEVEAYTGWGDGDFLPGTQQMIMTDAARQRVKQEKLVLLYELVNKGDLIALRMPDGQARTPEKTRIRAERYYKWKGVEVPVLAPEGWGYEVVPAPFAADADIWRREREILSQALPTVEAMAADAARRVLPEVIHLDQSLRAIEQVIEEVAVEFDGDDPCLPGLRRRLDDLSDQIELIIAGLAEQGEKLPEPGSNPQVKMIRDLVRSSAYQIDLVEEVVQDSILDLIAKARIHTIHDEEQAASELNSYSANS